MTPEETATKRLAAGGSFMQAPGMAFSSPDHDAFVLQIIDAQSKLYAYILSLTLDRELARDLLQQTNLVLLEKEDDFMPGTSFSSWSCKVAFYEVLSDRRDRRRDRLMFNDELLSMIALQTESNIGDIDQRADALRACLKQLTNEQRQLIAARYGPGGSVAEIAASASKTPGAISAALHRIRATLADCVTKRLGGAAE